MTEIRTTPGGTPTWVRDATANDADKTVTVPSGVRWEVQSIFAELVSTATVGNRSMQFVISNAAAAMIGTFNFGAIQAAGVTRYYSGYVGAPVNLATAPGFSLPLPPLILPAGYTIRVYDAAVIDAAADDMTVSIQYIAHSV